MRIHRIAPASCALLLASLWASRAGAQEPAPAPPAPAAPAPAPAAAAPAPAPAPAAPAAAAEPKEDTATDENTDHDRFVGHLAVGYFGISQLPYASGGGVAGGGTLTTGTVSAPVVGVRYWFNRQFGLDVGAGLSLSTFSNSQTPAPNPAPQNPPTIFGFALHGGVPIALATAKHFTFEIIPEVTFGYATTSIEQANPAPNVSVNGLRLDIGGRVGAEINFGFIGLPQLALQGTVGLFARYQNVGASVNSYTAANGTNVPSASASNGVFTLGTSVGSDPWAIFTDNISALYYF
ncbi:MAG TPA: hypothetical protein VF765_30850 [Polyangiaceae bacterium]